MARHTVACRATVFALYHLTELFHRQSTAPNLNEGAHNGAHHVAQKTIGSDGKDPPQLSLRGREHCPSFGGNRGGCPLGFGDVTDIRLGIGIDL